MTGPGQHSPQDLAAAYALGALTPEEARRVEAWLATSAEGRREVDEYREVAALLALTGPAGAPAAAPGADLRGRVLAAVAGERRGAPESSSVRELVPRRRWALGAALAASILLAVGLGAALVMTRGRLTALDAELSARSAALAEARQRLTERDATLDAVLGPGVRLFQLTQSGDPEPGLQLFWDQRRRMALLHGYRLKPVPAGKAYQLWFIKDGAPVPSVTFRPESDGDVRVRDVPVPAEGELSAAAVTVEPEGGSAQPTSPIVMLGTLKRS